MSQQEFSEQEIFRRQSLDELRNIGIEPYPAAEFVTNAFSSDIKAEFNDAGVIEPEFCKTINPRKTDGTQTYQQDRIYQTDGVLVALSAELNGRFNICTEPSILTTERTEYGKAIRHEYEKKNITAKRKELKQHKPRKDGVSNCLTTITSDNLLAEPNRYYGRIRKLTPKECWRLMDFDDIDFEKAKASGVSDSQLYKQAGNSIVVAVLESIFKMMLPNGERI